VEARWSWKLLGCCCREINCHLLWLLDTMVILFSKLYYV